MQGANFIIWKEYPIVIAKDESPETIYDYR